MYEKRLAINLTVIAKVNAFFVCQVKLLVSSIVDQIF